MESIVNYDKDEKEKIADLAANARTTIFNFDYPLSTNVSRETFETTILNHYIMRRINFETVTLFRIMLHSKLVEVMPKYNLLFDALNGWELFKGATITHNYTENSTDNRTTNSGGSNTTTANSKVDNRFSDTPQSAISEVKSGQYVSEYSYNEADTTNTTTNTTNGKDANIGSKTITETTSSDRENESEIIIDFINKYNNIYTMLYNDLDDLFYGLV